MSVNVLVTQILESLENSARGNEVAVCGLYIILFYCKRSHDNGGARASLAVYKRCLPPIGYPHIQAMPTGPLYRVT